MKRKLTLTLYVKKFRKQFLFQKEPNTYLTNYSHEAGLPHSHYAVMIFLVVGKEFGFDIGDLLLELKMDYWKAEKLLKEWEYIFAHGREEAPELYYWIKNKAGMVHSAVNWGIRGL